MPFTFKVKRKIPHECGVAVIGKVLEGTIVASSKAVVAVGRNEYPAYIGQIVDQASGAHMQCCSGGNNVSLILIGIDARLVKPRITIVKDVGTVMPHESSYSNSEESQTNKTIRKVKEAIEVEIDRERYKKSYKKCAVAYTSNEKDYIKDIKMCVKSKEKLAPTELYVLDKLRIAYGIPEKRAQELILKTIKEYNKEKNKLLYSDAVAACLLDCGYLTANERHLLERLRVALNISEQESYTIEKDSSWDV